ncbi:gluconate 2-dehydrogenase subunit 3 family protein [Enterobacteriaceae bacterium BIT-l23]|uniref:Gluconate 2-dehydrogenase subunit 3 family protein n=1 Tax=Jejubacter calystegiae TaxID=2579935 RepID=A0A4P8YEP1_9ENTR|nr:gluconate 2-dehydrogenase subunit 3 family protein [Jejubacter calystegiae]NUU65961.1 gluconate 2-dehydrogenase subunit 3 family protein [Enterobacteriaceae bacterium BIT-l23]QCT19095.1 gluconate 2-dehydrogenase subunit 3 family protein [Jejubacter calystegiae]
MKRREFLSSLAVLGVASTLPAAGKAAEVSGGQPWEPGKIQTPPAPPRKGGLQFFTQHEFETVGAIAECFIPADELSISGKEAGCATFIDRQLAGDYGRAATLYRRGRFIKGTPEQGPQSALTPAERYRQGLKALDTATHKRFGKDFVALSTEQQEQLLHAMEANNLDLGPEVDTKVLFELLLQNVREGFLADPIYGGNKGMASWNMIGFPGARYDFRDLLSKKGQKLNIIPTSLIDNGL